MGCDPLSHYNASVLNFVAEILNYLGGIHPFLGILYQKNKNGINCVSNWSYIGKF